jgi:hypothetical protein
VICQDVTHQVLGDLGKDCSRQDRRRQCDGASDRAEIAEPHPYRHGPADAGFGPEPGADPVREMMQCGVSCRAPPVLRPIGLDDASRLLGRGPINPSINYRGAKEKPLRRLAYYSPDADFTAPSAVGVVVLRAGRAAHDPDVARCAADHCGPTSSGF